MRMRLICRWGLGWIGSLMLISCGSVSTQTLQPMTGPVPAGLPERIVVLPLTAENCLWNLEVSSGDEATIRSSLPNWLAGAMVKELGALAPSSGSTEEVVLNQWVVQGVLKRVLLPDPQVSGSNRKPVLECTVFIFDWNRSRVQPFMSYDVLVREVVPDPLAETDESVSGLQKYLEWEIKEVAALVAQSLTGYVEERGWKVSK
ncbi:MAG: hypothetical protein HC904_01765 [Blastochloris sp.]|nr:hypothetical protein [Blastochloris sp.]